MLVVVCCCLWSVVVGWLFVDVRCFKIAVRCCFFFFFFWGGDDLLLVDVRRCVCSLVGAAAWFVFVVASCLFAMRC